MNRDYLIEKEDIDEMIEDMDINGWIEERKKHGENLLESEELYVTTLDFMPVVSLNGIEKLKKLKRLFFDIDEKHHMQYDNDYLKKVIKEIVVIFNGVHCYLPFLCNYKNLEKLSLSRDGPEEWPVPPGFLENLNLQGSLREFSMSSGDITDINWISDYSKLESLSIQSCKSLKSFSGLYSAAIKHQLKKLELNLLPELRNVDFLEGYQNLKEISLNVLENLKDFLGLNSSSIKKTVQEIGLFYLDNLLSLDFLEGFEKLEKIVVIDNKNVIDFSSLDSSLLKQSVRQLDFSNLDGLTDISFLQDYEHLEELRLLELNNVNKFTPLSSANLTRHLKKLQLGRVPNLMSIDFLKNYELLEKLDINYFSIKDISNLLDYKFIRNGCLKEIILPESIDWTMIKNGNFANSETVSELRKRGVDVYLPSTFKYYEEKKHNPLIYVICGPSGAGKSTLINFMINELGGKCIKKTTTRPIRSLQETKQKIINTVSVADFVYSLKEGKMLAGHEFYGELYGVSMVDLASAYLSDDVHFLDFVEPEAAFALRDSNPDFVKVILLLPPANLVEAGLQSRLEDLTQPYIKLNNFEKQTDFLRGINTNIISTEDRIKHIAEDHLRLVSYKHYADYVIEGFGYDKNMKKVREIIKGK